MQVSYIIASVISSVIHFTYDKDSVTKNSTLTLHVLLMVTKQKFRNYRFIGESCRYFTLKTETVPSNLRQRMLHKNGSV